jgi:hypothetical protein
MQHRHHNHSVSRKSLGIRTYASRRSIICAKLRFENEPIVNATPQKKGREEEEGDGAVIWRQMTCNEIQRRHKQQPPH